MIVLHNLGLMSNLVLGILLKVLMWFAQFAQFSPISSVIFSWFDMFPLVSCFQSSVLQKSRWVNITILSL